MSINREFWLKPFPKNNFPNWMCPKCGVGVLRSLEKTFSFDESGDITVERIRAGEYFDYGVYTFKYSVLLKCDNQNCQERVSSCGDGYVKEYTDFEDKDGTQITGYMEFFTPEYFYPALNMFFVSPKCSDDVAREIKSSFKLFFADPPASANYVRKTIDAILTDKKIKKYTSNNRGKRQLINLHDRIMLFQSKQPEVAQKLLAIKWLGNEGSHTNKITKNDLLDAYEILEVIIDDLYVGYRKLVEKKVEKINKSRKPLHPST